MKFFNINNDIIKAAQENDFSLVQELSRNHNLDFRDKNGKTPLFYAVENENIEMCEFLLDKGVNLYIRDDRSLMAIHYAVMLNNEKIINLFMKKDFRYDINYIVEECRGISIKDNRKILSFIKKIF